MLHNDEVAIRVNKIHKNMLRRTVEDGIDMGELLTERKKEIKRGKWCKWVADNISFSYSTVAFYMKMYRCRKSIKSKKLNSLGDVRYLFDKRSKPKYRNVKIGVIKWCKLVSLETLFKVLNALKILNEIEILTTPRNQRLEEICEKEIEIKILEGEKAQAIT